MFMYLNFFVLSNKGTVEDNNYHWSNNRTNNLVVICKLYGYYMIFFIMTINVEWD